jgi:CDP-diglyceride synthetase
MDWLAEMYITLLPGLIAGVLNMIWCKLPLPALGKPIDGGRNWRDGKRLFGDHKTWQGVVGMIGLAAGCNLAWGAVCAQDSYLTAHNYFYLGPFGNTVGYNLVIGVAIGLAYALSELPNSFLKRRLAVNPGEPAPKGWAIVSVAADQADSVIGMVIVVGCIHPLSFGYFLAYVAVGAVTHLLVNLLLYSAHLRKRPL